MPFDQSNYQPEPVDEVLRNLIAGRAVIARKEDWYPHARQGACAYLAVCRTSSSYGTWAFTPSHFEATAALLAAIPPRGWGLENSDLWHFNDTHSHADVLALFDRAIAARREHLAAKAADAVKAQP